MPVRGHEGQMGQHPHLRASQKLRSLGLCLGQEVKEKHGFFQEKEPGVRRWRVRTETLPPGSLFSFSFFFLMERVKLFLKRIHHEYLLLVQVLSWL